MIVWEENRALEDMSVACGVERMEWMDGRKEATQAGGGEKAQESKVVIRSGT